MKALFTSFFLAVTLLLAASQAQCADLTLSATIGGTFDLDFNPISHELALTSTTPVIWQVDFAVLTENLAFGEAGFGNVGFSVSLQNASDALNLGWQPANTSAGSYDPLARSSSSLFAWNLDAGPASDDEHGILVSIAGGLTNPADPRTRVGQNPGSPGRIGSLFVQDNFLDAASLSIDLAMFASYDVNGKFFDVQTAYGQNRLMLPRAGAGPSLLSVSTANAPPPQPEPIFLPPVVPEPVVPVPIVPEPIVPSLPPTPVPNQPPVPAIPSEPPTRNPEPTPTAPPEVRPDPQRPDFSLVTTIGGAFDLNFNPISREAALASAEPVIWQVDFGVVTENGSPSEAGFGNVAFSVNFQNSSDALNLGWQPHNPSLPTGVGPAGLSSPSEFLLNMDAGPANDDEHGILISIAGGVTNPADPRRSLGQTPGSPDLIGSLFVQDDPLGMSSLAVEQVMFASNDANGKFFGVESAYGQMSMQLPRSPEGGSMINVSTANSPPEPEPVVLPVIPTEPPDIDVPPPYEPLLPIDQPEEIPTESPESYVPEPFIPQPEPTPNPEPSETIEPEIPIPGSEINPPATYPVINPPNWTSWIDTVPPDLTEIVVLPGVLLPWTNQHISLCDCALPSYFFTDFDRGVTDRLVHNRAIDTADFTVPEPTAMVLLLLGTTTLTSRFRRRFR